MKRLLRFLIIILLPQVAIAHQFEVDGIYYNFIDENSLEVTFYSEAHTMRDYKELQLYSGKVVIPPTVTYEGKTYKELLCDPRYQDWVDAAGTTAFPGGESREAFTERSFRGFLEALGDPEQEETVLIVCHGGNIMAVLSRLTGEDYYAFMAEPLGGYRLDLEMEDERISALTYKRIACGDPAGLDHR